MADHPGTETDSQAMKVALRPEIESLSAGVHEMHGRAGQGLIREMEGCPQVKEEFRADTWGQQRQCDHLTWSRPQAPEALDTGIQIRRRQQRIDFHRHPAKPGPQPY